VYALGRSESGVGCCATRGRLVAQLTLALADPTDV